MADQPQRSFTIRPLTPADVPAARDLMIRIFEQDFGYGYRPEFHGDVDQMQATYIDNPRNILYVAVDDDTSEIAATAGVRSGGLKPDFNHAWLVERYDPERSAQIVRVYVDRAYRRNGLARRLVDAAVQFVATIDSYDVLILHTDPRSPGAEAFWRSMPARLILDDRDGISEALHFEMDIPGRAAGSEKEKP